MSKKPEKRSVAAARESRENASVFDFLYHDSRRIASFLAQLEELGHLQQVTQTDHAEEGESEDSRTTGSLGVPGAIGGKIDSGIGGSSSRSESSQRVYDPFWANARRFLDLLTERGMISRDIETARIGQFVLVTGALVIADLASWRDIWKAPVVKQFMQVLAHEAEALTAAQEQGGNRQQRAAAKQKGSKKPSEMDLVLELLPYLPHSPQIHIVTDDFAAWGTVDASHMTGTLADLMLKHGSKIAGQWSALGILDGMPFEAGELLSPLESIRVGANGQNVTQVAITLGPNIRQMLGRPLLSYGFTPLLIFREVA